MALRFIKKAAPAPRPTASRSPAIKPGSFAARSDPQYCSRCGGERPQLWFAIGCVDKACTGRYIVMGGHPGVADAVKAGALKTDDPVRHALREQNRAHTFECN